MGFDRIRIKTELAKRNIYQYDFAQRLNITESHLSRILKGRSKPSEAIEKACAKALQVSVQ